MKRKHDCGYCGELFNNITDHMTHVVQQHHGEKHQRPWHCWACAQEVPATQAQCSCGFNHPQLTEEKA